MFSTVEQFVTDFKNESIGTQKLLDLLTDESLNQKVWDEGRTLGFLGWHLVLTLGEMMGKAGLKLDAPAENANVPTVAKEIADTYRKVSSELLEKIAIEWKEKNLDEKIEMYGEKWSRSDTLTALIKHEIHHRGQITVLMRQAGLKVTGIYGPAKEEWAAFNMPPMP